MLSAMYLLLGTVMSVSGEIRTHWTQRDWDVIIVGAGPAGIIVADRMSEANKTTLLLEGGGPSYYVTGGRERPSWLNNTTLSRVDVPGLYKSIFDDGSDLVCGNQTNAFGGCVQYSTSTSLPERLIARQVYSRRL